MIEGIDALREAVFNLQEDFKAFRESMAERLNYLERHLPPAQAAEYRALVRQQEIEGFRNGR